MIKTWGTWDGRVIEFERLTWQHLSNIHFYMNITMRKAYNNLDRAMIRQVLFNKYGGILPYHPDRSFAFEKIRLVDLGYLRNNGDIVVDGHKIGWYEEPLVNEIKNIMTPYRIHYINDKKQKPECPICKYFKDRGIELKSENGKPIKINKDILNQL